MEEYNEQHAIGHLSIENVELILEMDKMNSDIGVQIAKDGRIWICINGIAFIRFRPKKVINI
jgi:streptogramin lyase